MAYCLDSTSCCQNWSWLALISKIQGYPSEGKRCYCHQSLKLAWKLLTWNIIQILQGPINWNFRSHALYLDFSHTEYERDGYKFLRMKFYIEGPMAKGTVQLEMKKVSDLDGLVWERRNPSALAMELRLSCTNPLIWTLVLWSLD